jgi:hypothetical protein
MITSLPSIAVLIDCWQSLKPYNRANNFYTTICSVIDNNPAITIVVLASYNTSECLSDSDNIWYANQRHWFNHSEKTADIILNYKNPKKIQVAITQLEDLKFLLECNPKIKNIYVMGATWNSCVHHRPIGVNNCAILGKNILIDIRSVWNKWDEIDNIPDLDNDINYAKIDEHLYMLKQND